MDDTELLREFGGRHSEEAFRMLVERHIGFVYAVALRQLRNPSAAEEATQAAIRAALQHYPSLRTEVLTFLGDRLSESLSGEAAPVAVNVFGPDLDELDRVADEIAAVARTVPGASDVQVQAPSGAPFLRVDLRPEQLGQYGFTAADVLDTVETAYQGTTAAQIYDANKVIDLTVRLPPAERVDPEAIGQLLVRTANGVTVPLKDLATLSLTEGRTGIMHEGARRRQVVTLNPTTSDIGGFVARLQKAVARRVQLPPTVYLDFAGAASGERQARHELLVHALVVRLKDGIVPLDLVFAVFHYWPSTVSIPAVSETSVCCPISLFSKNHRARLDGRRGTM